MRDGIWVLRLEGVLNVKRLLLEPGGKVTVRSDNQAYASLPSLDRDQVDLIGRVVWAGRRLG